MGRFKERMDNKVLFLLPLLITQSIVIVLYLFYYDIDIIIASAFFIPSAWILVGIYLDREIK